MSQFRLLSAVLRGTWLIDTRVAEGYLPTIAKLITGQAVPKMWDDDDDDQEEIRGCYALGMSQDGGRQRFSSFDDAPAGSVAVIPVKGVIMKEDYCYEPGTETMAGWVNEAYSHPNISAVILLMDTGGGSVDGTFEFADVIGQRTKPVVAYGSGMIASAGVALAVPADEIWLSHETAEIGSVGTAMSIRDYSKQMEEYGVKTHYLRAPDSKDKNEDYLQVLKGNYQPMIEHILKPTNDIFLAHVRRHRAGKLREQAGEGGLSGEPLTGQMYLAKAAIANGLADRIGTFEQAVERAMELAAGKQAASNPLSFNNSSMKIKLSAAWGAVLALCGASAIAGADHTEVELSAEQVQGHLASLQSQIDALTAEKAQAAADLAAAQAKVTTLEGDKATLEQRVADLGANTPGATFSAPVRAGGDKIESTATADAWDDPNLEFNQRIDNSRVGRRRV